MNRAAVLAALASVHSGHMLDRNSAALACSEIPSDAITILRVSLAVMPLQIVFFAQHLAVYQRRGRNEMKEFSNQSGGLYVHSPQGDKLQETFTNIVDELRNQYTLTYYPTNQKRDGRWRKLSIGAARPGLSVRTRRGYFAPKA